MGLIPYHSSLSDFLRVLSEHTDYSDLHRSRALAWLQDGAPDYWKWAFQWQVESDLEVWNPTITNPTKEWVVDAIAKRRPQADINRLLGLTSKAAFANQDLVRAVEAGLYCDYANIPFDYNREVFEKLLYAQLVLEEDMHLRPRLMHELGELTENEISVLAEFQFRLGDLRSVERCEEELSDRLENRSWRWSSPSDTREEDVVQALLSVSACLSGDRVEKVLEWGNANVSTGYSRSIMSYYSNQLRKRKDLASLRLAVFVLLKTGDFDGTFREMALQVILRHLVLLALEEGRDIDDVVGTITGVQSSFPPIYGFLRGVEWSDSIHLPSSSRLEISTDRFDDRHTELAGTFYEAFFCALANRLCRMDNETHNWLEDLGRHTWPRRFCSRLVETAEDLADTLLSDGELNMGDIYSRLSGFPQPDNTEESYVMSLDMSNAAISAAQEISRDLLCLRKPSSPRPHISTTDLQAARESGYWRPLQWTESYVSGRSPLLTEQALASLSKSFLDDLSSFIMPFTDRTEQFAAVAAIFALHDELEHAKEMVLHASDNLIAHGYHKDLLLTEAIDSILVLAKDDGYKEPLLSSGELWDLLRTLVPAVTAAGEFTDGDETSHLPTHLARALADVAPILLPGYLKWLSENEEDYDAASVFPVILGSLDLSDPFAYAIGQTAVDEQSYNVLQEQAREGNEEAAALVHLHDSLYGIRREAESGEVIQSNPNMKNAEKGDLDLQNYPPDLFEEYLSCLAADRIGFIEDEVRKWIEFWSTRGKKPEVQKALNRTSDRGHHLRVDDEIFSLTMELYGPDEAYPWLIKAQKRSYGWSRYYTYKDAAEFRWQAIVNHYPSRWLDFVVKTLARFDGEGDLVISPRNVVRLVEYCLFTDHADVAIQLTYSFTLLAASLVSAQNLAQPVWAG